MHKIIFKINMLDQLEIVEMKAGLHECENGKKSKAERKKIEMMRREMIQDITSSCLSWIHTHPMGWQDHEGDRSDLQIKISQLSRKAQKINDTQRNLGISNGKPWIHGPFAGIIRKVSHCQVCRFTRQFESLRKPIMVWMKSLEYLIDLYIK